MRKQLKKIKNKFSQPQMFFIFPYKSGDGQPLAYHIFIFFRLQLIKIIEALMSLDKIA